MQQLAFDIGKIVWDHLFRLQDGNWTLAGSVFVQRKLNTEFDGLRLTRGGGVNLWGVPGVKFKGNGVHGGS